MATPDDRRYTEQHEWALVQGSDGGSTVVRVGLTDHAQDALGDIVFVQLPAVGDEVGPGNPMGEVESTKSVSDVYAPVAGLDQRPLVLVGVATVVRGGHAGIVSWGREGRRRQPSVSGAAY